MHATRVHSFSFVGTLQAKLSDIIGIINKLAPPVLAEEWDNVGLQVGNPTDVIHRIMVALDPISVAMDAAIENSCQLLITHHPLIFKPLKKIITTDGTGSLVHKAIANGLAVVSLHTNYDIVASGVNDLLAATLGLTSTRPLKISQREELVKLVVFVPLTHHEAVMNALLPFCRVSSNYADCSFSSPGKGTFRPLEGASPFIGTAGKRELVDESRLELLISRGTLQSVLRTLHRVHPYEEPAYDIIPTLNEGSRSGIGRVGELAAATDLRGFAEHVKTALGASAIRIVGDLDRPVSKVALCGGSGAFLLRDAVREGADLLLTGDIKYHEAREGESMGIALIDAGHFATEFVMVAGLVRQLEHELENRKLDVELLGCTAESDPFRMI